MIVARQCPEMFLEGYFAVTQGQWGMLLGKDEEWDCHAPLSLKLLRTETSLDATLPVSRHGETVIGFLNAFFKALAINIVFLSFHCCPALDIHYDECLKCT